MSSDLKVTNIKHESSASNNLVMGSDGNVSITNEITSGTFNGTIGGTTLYPSGFIRQTKVNQDNVQKTATNTANVPVISQEITSGSQNSKILITFSGRVYTGSANTELKLSFGTSNLASDIDSGYSLYDTDGAIAERACHQVLYDIPQSTTKTIYVSILSGNSNSVYVNINGSTDGYYVLTLQEIID